MDTRVSSSVSQAEQGGVGSLRAILAAGGAAQAADALASVGPAVQAQVARAALAVGRAVRVGTSQMREAFCAHLFYFTQPRTGREAL